MFSDEKNAWAFRSAYSFSFSLVEQLSGGLGVTFNNDGVLMGILNNLAHGDKLEISFENGDIVRFVSNAAVLTGAISMVGLTFTDLSKEVIYMIINGKLLNNNNKAP